MIRMLPRTVGKSRSRGFRLVGKKAIQWLLVALCGIPSALFLGIRFSPHFRDSVRRLAGEMLVESDSPEPADLVLVLGGDFYGNRVLKGAELGRLGFARRVLISGPPYVQNGTRVVQSDLAIRFLQNKGYPASLFLSCPNNAASTVEEATVLKPVLRALRARRVLLVTSNYHSRRAGIIFRCLIPDITFIVIGCAEQNYDPERWWTYEPAKQTFLMEWEKMIWNIGYRVWATKLQMLWT